MSNKYENGKIYKIYSKKDEEMVYLGSTCRYLLQTRLDCHIEDYKNGGKRTTCHDIFTKHGTEDLVIELVEDWPSETKEKLLKREAYHIRKMKCINKNIHLRTKKEYNEDNREQINAKQKEYDQKNKELIKQKLNVTVVCECGCSMKKKNLSAHKKTKKHIEALQPKQ